MKDQQAWIVNYINEVHHKDASDVIVCGVPGFKGGGGGLYCKTEENEKSFGNMKAAAVNEAHAPAEKIEKGKFLLVKSDPSKPGEKAVVCFILWHEFGHALADRGVGSNVGETSAWKFELEAITHAVKNGLPAGITNDMVWGFLDIRQGSNYGTTLDGEINALKLALGPRPHALNEAYAYAAKTCCINFLGQFEPDRFKAQIGKYWPSLSDNDKKNIKTATDITWR